jgi:hypothetical protein
LVSDPEVPVIESWMTDAVVAELRRRGCPLETAERLARGVEIEGPEEIDGLPHWTVMLCGHGHGFHMPVDPDEWEWAISSVVANVANDNAEAKDRTARGESGWLPLWPLPGRPARRR